MNRLWVTAGVWLAWWALPLHGQHKAHQRPAPVTQGRLLTPLTERERVEQLLDRFTYGPRPGEIDRVEAQGGAAWLEQQLNPGTVPDPVLSRRLADYPTLNLSTAQALLAFPDRQQVKQMADGRQALPTDPLQRAVVEVLMTKLEDRPAKAEGKAGQATVSTSTAAAALVKAEPPPEDRQASHETAARLAGTLLAMPKEQRMAAIIAMPVRDRLAVTGNRNLSQAERQLLLQDFTPREREAFQAMSGGIDSAVVLGTELAQARVLRDILSERQIEAVMTDFWFNHFNVTLEKGADRWYTAGFEREAIRPHALGKFGDLLLATATSPAMMVYLDNLDSIGPDSAANEGGRPAGKKGPRGLNENYGREVMELHTVGVSAGYTQADVTALASILTGWTVEQPQQGGPFAFNPRRHEPGAKAWWGHCVAEDGSVTELGVAGTAACPAGVAPATATSVQQGMAALKLLAKSPQTAHHISYLLAQYFVADVPPNALVDRLSAVYLQTDGDIKALLRAIAVSPEFNSRQYFRTKVKTPMEFLASAYRSTATDPHNPEAIVNEARVMGMPLYRALPPTGYYLTADQWMNSTALVDRLNFAYQLSSGKVPNQPFDGARLFTAGLLGSPHLPEPLSSPTLAKASPTKVSSVTLRTTSSLAPETVSVGAAFATQLLGEVMTGGPVSAKTSQLIETQVVAEGQGKQGGEEPGQQINLIAGLLLGSPEFQRR